MSSLNFNLRGIPQQLMILLKKEAKNSRTSVNILILTIIEKGLGLKQQRVLFHDLDHLAGSWSAAEAREFEQNTQYFEKIDEEFWS